MAGLGPLGLPGAINFVLALHVGAAAAYGAGKGIAFLVRRSESRFAQWYDGMLLGQWRALIADHRIVMVGAGIETLSNMSEELAAKSYDILLDPKTGFTRRAELDVDGVKTVLGLRSEYGEPRKQLTDAAKYYDLQYYKKARGQ